jgi:hypothetical protein
MTFLTNLECGMCGETPDPERIWNLCPKSAVEST